MGRKWIVRFKERHRQPILVELVKAKGGKGFLIVINDQIAYSGHVFSIEEALLKIDLVKNARYVVEEVKEIVDGEGTANNGRKRRNEQKGEGNAGEGT